MTQQNVLREATKQKLAQPKSNAFLLMPKSMIGTISLSMSVRQALEKMRYHGYTAMPVVTDQGEYYGTVTEGDFLRFLVDDASHNLYKMEAVQLQDIMRSYWNFPVKLDTSMDEVFQRVLDQNFIPVVDDRNMFMGIITRKSVLQYYHKILSE